jgi:hypothetical protein
MSQAGGVNGSDGSVDVAIGVFEGQVVARWKDPLREITFDPPNAYKIGLALSHAALEAHNGAAGKEAVEFIAGELAEVKVHVSDLQRMAMVQVVATIVRTLTDQKRTAGYIAQHCVDAVLKDTAR